MRNENELKTDAEAGGDVQQGRDELLPAGMQRRSSAEALKESDLSEEERQATIPQTDPLSAASNETIAHIREMDAEEAGAHATMPAPGRQELSEDELERRRARRAVLEGEVADSSAHGESFGGVVVDVAESRRRLLFGQVPQEALTEEALAAQGGNIDFAVRDANAARLNRMREFARKAAEPSGEAIGGRVRSGAGAGDALRGGTGGANLGGSGGADLGASGATPNTGSGGSSLSPAGGITGAGGGGSGISGVTDGSTDSGGAGGQGTR